MTLDDLLDLLLKTDPLGIAKRLSDPAELDDALQLLAFELRTAKGAAEKAQTEADMWLEQLLTERAETELNQREGSKALQSVIKLMNTEEAERAEVVLDLEDDVALKSACIRGMDRRMCEWHTEVERLTAENADLKAQVVKLWEDAAGGGCDEGL